MTPDPQIPPWTSVLTPSININNVHPLKEVNIFRIPILNSEKNTFSTIIEVSGTSFRLRILTGTGIPVPSLIAVITNVQPAPLLITTHRIC